MKIRIDVGRLLHDLPIENAEIPAVMQRHGAPISDGAARKWIERGRLPVDRLAILLLEARKRRKSVDFLDYVAQERR